MRVLLLLVVISAAGCGSVAAKEAITLDQVPENVMAIAKEKLPGVKFEKAWRKKNGEYEVSGKDSKGKVREIDITADGTVTEVE